MCRLYTELFLTSSEIAVCCLIHFNEKKGFLISIADANGLTGSACLCFVSPFTAERMMLSALYTSFYSSSKPFPSMDRRDNYVSF